MNSETWVAGAETDASLLPRLGVALRALGYELGEHWSGIAGSQEISNFEIQSVRGSLSIEVETYMGVTIQGPSELVSEVRAAFSTSE
jgi:hypothetical protein